MGTALIGRQPSRHARRQGPEAAPGEEPLDDALRRAVAGDESGFAELWRALHPRLLRYLRVRSANYEDVAAETWLHVVRDISRFEGTADRFRAWLFVVARNRAIDAARAAAARPLVLVPDVAAEGQQPTTPPAESEALDHISTERAVELVKQLPPDQADMVMLRVVAGLDVPVVAEIVGKSPGAVRVSVHRGLRALARDPSLRSRAV
ncbi:MAG TPA: sigma-70 family RNA polymerase sigma factor [Mycobacteriales bacterium]|nr:sigma-70 family RNA polymerase sigma factor [Mycobacteriales bacterium]